MPDASEQIFEYRFISKHRGLLWALVIIVPGLGVSVYGAVMNKGQTLLNLIVGLSILIPLILLAILKEKKDQVELTEIKVSTDGIWAHLRKNQLEWLPKKNVQFVPWSSISYHQIYSYPDPDAVEMAGVGGVRLIIKDNDRKISIYENIENYESLLIFIMRKVPPG